MKYPYTVLGLPENTADTEIRNSYLAKIKEFPPEKYPEKFQDIAEAYDMIKDELSRAKLSVFGMKHEGNNIKLSQMLIESKKKRKKIGVDSWFKLL